MEFKANIGDPKTGKCYKKDIIGDEAKEILGKKIGDKVTGSKIGLTGYEFEITGGSDSSGFPMRKDVEGSKRKRVLLASGVGTRHNRKGMRLRRTVVGRKVSQKTVQVNMKILKYGKDALDTAPATAPKDEATETKVSETQAKPESPAPAAEEKPVEASKEEAKPKAEEKKEEPKEDTKSKDSKPQPKVEEAKKEKAEPEAKEKTPAKEKKK